MAIRKESYDSAFLTGNVSGGLAQRDYVAVEAMKGILASASRQELFIGLMQGGEEGMWGALAQKAYKMADAMIEASK